MRVLRAGPVSASFIVPDQNDAEPTREADQAGVNSLVYEFFRDADQANSLFLVDTCMNTSNQLCVFRNED